ncbi:MAG TPA: hypothetical protein VGI70_00460, partial [Polyangiales bacterium]
LSSALDGAALVQLAALAARQIAQSDLAIVDPVAFDGTFNQTAGTSLQRGQVDRAIPFDSRLVVASVTLDWLAALNKKLDSPRPVALFGTTVDGSDTLIAGRLSVPGAHYRVVTTAVLARSGRLPDGATWTPLDVPNATLRGALLAHLSAANSSDPRKTLRDPADSTQWLLRTDGQLQGNLTSTRNPAAYDEPTLQLNQSRQLAVQLVVNMDGDAPNFLFENAVQLAFDRNFATHTTAQDLDFVQSTYTYSGLWPSPYFYPHPFVEGYIETAFEHGDTSYHHLLLRPEIGLRSLFSRVLSLKLSAAIQVEALSPDHKALPGLSAELVMKPWTWTSGTSSIHLEGNISYLWFSPADLDQQTLRGQLISAIQIVGPLQFTLTALGAIRKDRHEHVGKGLSIQAGIRLRFIERVMTD